MCTNAKCFLWDCIIECLYQIPLTINLEYNCHHLRQHYAGLHSSLGQKSLLSLSAGLAPPPQLSLTLVGDSLGSQPSVQPGREGFCGGRKGWGFCPCSYPSPTACCSPAVGVLGPGPQGPSPQSCPCWARPQCRTAQVGGLWGERS